MLLNIEPLKVDEDYEVPKILELKNADAINLSEVLHDVLVNKTEKIKKLPENRIRRDILFLNDYIESL